VGGGFALALAADIRLAARGARFGVAFNQMGLSGCDIGVSYLLPKLVGASRSFEMMLTGRVIDADEALAAGLLSAVVEPQELLDRAFDTAGVIAKNSAFGTWMTKRVMWSNLDASNLAAAIDLENRTQILATFTGDMDEALEAFRQKRAPEYDPL
jgi:enoyl-CoA hydratase